MKTLLTINKEDLEPVYYSVGYITWHHFWNQVSLQHINLVSDQVSDQVNGQVWIPVWNQIYENFYNK
jgi:hypothetical protein